MNIVLTLLCRNEIDIIEQLIKFYLDRDIDYIIATDNGSSDGTKELLAEYKNKGYLYLISEPNFTHDQSVWVTRMARLAAIEFNADWIINSDADEFWWPSNNSYKHLFEKVPEHIDIINVPRTNFLPMAKEGGPFYSRMIYRELISLNSVGKPILPKVCHRAHPDVTVLDGNHSAIFTDRNSNITQIDELNILHFPLRSYKQFERKIREGAEAIERNARLKSTTVGRTWKFLYNEYYKSGTLHEYYLTQCLSENEILHKLNSNQITIDTRIRDYLTTQLQFKT